MAITEKLVLQNMINGEFVDPVDGQMEDVINPSTGEVIASSPLSSAEDANRAVAAAKAAFEGAWSTSSPKTRMDLLLQLADAIGRREEAAHLWILVGKSGVRRRTGQQRQSEEARARDHDETLLHDPPGLGPAVVVRLV